MTDLDKHTERLNGTWRSWGHHVLETINRLEAKIDKLEKHQHERDLTYQKDIVAIKTKAGIIGAIAGGFGSIIIAIGVSVSAKYIFINTLQEETHKNTEQRLEEEEELSPQNMYEYLEERKKEKEKQNNGRG